MNIKPKNNSTTLKSILVNLVAILLTLAIPATASAKTVQIGIQPLFSAVLTTNTLKNTTLFATTSTLDEDDSADDVSQEDLGKAKRLDDYFAKRDMPLEGYGIEFVKSAKKYNLDWRLLAAIGVRESSGGKHMMNNNPFGWGSAKIKFDDFNEAIDVVSSNLGGFNPNTARYYKDADTKKKLWYYNGTVIRSYPAEVIDIMEMF